MTAILLAKGEFARLPSGITIGHATNAPAATGCTVLVCTQGAVCSVAVRGGAPATRETDLLAPENMVQSIHAVLLSGGSAYGLDAAGGVMQYLEEQQVGVQFGGAVVPIVVGAALFDLDLGSATIRPDAAMGYAAASSADSHIGPTGNVGAGTGASVGRFMGQAKAMKGGFGAASVQSDAVLVTALVAVNSLGNVFSSEVGGYIAGARFEHEGVDTIVEPLDVLPQLLKDDAGDSAAKAHTTIGVVLTNAALSKDQAYRVSGMAHDGFARALYPVHTSFDGDALFALATGEVEAQADVVGVLAAYAVEHAILDAVHSAEEAYGLPSASSFASLTKETAPST